MTPVWLNRAATLTKVISYVNQASEQGCDLVCFGEALVPGYPFWLASTGGADFNNQVQKEIHARYLQEGVVPEQGHLEGVQAAAKKGKIMVVLGIMERPLERGGHTLYASAVTIGRDGEILSIHRKLMPTYEERLAWGIGDGHGIKTHPLGPVCCPAPLPLYLIYIDVFVSLGSSPWVP